MSLRPSYLGCPRAPRLESGLAIHSDILGPGVLLLGSLLGERFSIATSLRLMQQAATLDRKDFEDSRTGSSGLASRRRGARGS